MALVARNHGFSSAANVLLLVCSLHFCFPCCLGLSSPTIIMAKSLLSPTTSYLNSITKHTKLDVPKVPTVPMDTPARKSLPPHLQLQTIPGKGMGVIATVKIPRNTMVGEYSGEIITTQVKDRRYLPSQQHLQDQDDRAWALSRQERGQGISGAYLYGVSMPGNAGADPIYIDAEDEYASLWTRFLNHAAPPGNNLSPKSIHESYDGNPRVWFVSNRDIEAGEELCFDYGDDYWLPGDQVF